MVDAALLCSIASQQTIFLRSFHTSPPHIESTESLSACTPKVKNPNYVLQHTGHAFRSHHSQQQVNKRNHELPSQCPNEAAY